MRQELGAFAAKRVLRHVGSSDLHSVAAHRHPVALLPAVMNPSGIAALASLASTAWQQLFAPLSTVPFVVGSGCVGASAACDALHRRLDSRQRCVVVRLLGDLGDVFGVNHLALAVEHKNRPR